MIEILISSSVLIVVLAILRLLLRDRISARLQYALWLLVLVRLLVPVSFFHSPVSVAEAAKPVAERAASLNSAIVYFKNAPVSAVYTSPENEMLVIQDAEPNFEAERVILLTDAARFVWYAGIAVMAAWLLFVNLRFSRRLKKTRTPYDEAAKPPVYIAAGIPSPCLFGLFDPAVYLTEQAAADPAQAAQIIAHERTHRRHGDLIWALLRGVCLAVWWFDPFVWLAAALSRQDCELACDEGTIRALGEDARFDYGRTLVGMARVGARPSDLLCGATTMTSGKRSLKMRVARIASAPKASVAVAVAVLLIAAVAVGCTYGGPAGETPEPEAAFEPAPGAVSATDADTPDALVPMIVVSGRLYCSTGEQLPGEPDPSAYAGTITSVVPRSEQPTEDDQANFGAAGAPYIMELYGPVVLLDNEWTRFVSADVVNYRAPAPVPVVITDGVVSASVTGGGQTAELTGPEELKRLLDVMGSISFEQIFDLGYAYAPGAQSVMVTLRYEDGSEMRWSYPVVMYNGAIFECASQSVGMFGQFLYPAEASGSADIREVSQVLSGFFSDPENVEVFVSDDFPVDETAEPLLLQHYIYDMDWRFDYNASHMANDPRATIKVTDDRGNVLWIMDDAGMLLIDRTDGTVIAATAVPDGLDTVDMINHLLPWARGEYTELDLIRTSLASTEAEAGSPVTSVVITYLGTEDPGFSERVGTVIDLDAAWYPATAQPRETRWVSSDESVATVDRDGRVTVVGAGRCIVTFWADDVSYDCEVRGFE